MVPGGVGKKDYGDIRTVTSLGIEPLHLLVRPALFEAASAKLTVLRGKRINLGPESDSLPIIARDLLLFAGLNPPTNTGAGDYIAETLSSSQIQERLRRIESLPAADRPARSRAWRTRSSCSLRCPRWWPGSSSPSPATGSCRSRSPRPIRSTGSTR